MTNGEWALVGIVWGIGVAWILDYFSISGEWLIIMTAMLMIDFFFWIISAKSRGEKIESRKRQHGLVKKVCRWLLPFIVAWWLKRTEMPWIDMLTHTIVGMIVFSELYSIIWHIYSINYWEELPEVDAFKMLMNWLVKFLKNLINKKNEELNPKDEDKPLSE